MFKNKFKSSSLKILKLPPRKYFFITTDFLLKFLLLFFLLFFCFLLFFSDFFKIKEVFCWQGESICNNKEIEAFDKFLKQNIFLIKKEKISREFLNSHPSIKEIEIKKQLPAKLVIKLVPRYPRAIIITKRGDFLIDETGFVFEEIKEKKNFTLPFIEIKTEETVTVGLKVNEKIKSALNLVKILERFFIPFKKINILEKGYLEVEMNNGKAIFSLQKDLETQAVSLQMILQSSKIREKEAAGSKIKIELFFEKPVVSFDE